MSAAGLAAVIVTGAVKPSLGFMSLSVVSLPWLGMVGTPLAGRSVSVRSNCTT